MESLSAESREIAAALNANVYHSDSGDRLLISETKLSHSSPCSVISIFSTCDLTAEAVCIAKPIAWLNENSCLRLIVPPDYDPEVLRKLHRLLLGNAQSLQNSSNA